MSNKNETIPVDQLPADEPRYGRWVRIFHHGPPLDVSTDQVCKVIEKAGNMWDGWRYVVEYKFTGGNERFFPPDFHIEPATEEEWNNQPLADYFPHKIRRWEEEYSKLPPLPHDSVSFTSGDWYEVYPEDESDPHGCRQIFPGKTDVIGLQEFYCKEMGEDACCWDRFLSDFYSKKGWKIKRVGGKYY